MKNHINSLATTSQKTRQIRFLRSTIILNAISILPRVIRLDYSVTTLKIGRELWRRISIRLHLLSFLKAIYLDFQCYQKSILSYSLMPIDRGLIVKNIVPDDSPIINACKSCNFSVVRTPFQSGKASIHDITLENQTLLYVDLFLNRLPE